MKNLIVFLSSLLILATSLSADPGKEVTANLSGTLIYGADIVEDGKKPLSGALREVIKKDSDLSHQHYYELGKDHTSVYKAYESWLRPLKPSEKFMVKCEPKAKTSKGQKLVMSFWLDKEIVFSTDVIDLAYDVPVLISGPKWREGKVIIAVQLEH